jgi:outer membrane protein TolC
MEKVESGSCAAKGYENARKIAEISYKEGEIDLTSLLVVRRQELQAKVALISAHGSRLTNRVDLHLALGGNFEEGPIDLLPVPPDNQKVSSTK